MSISRSLKVAIGGSLLSMFLFSNCAGAARVHVHRRPVVIHKSHVHTVGCGHYFHRNNWYFVKGHIHGHRCGHVLNRGIWVIR